MRCLLFILASALAMSHAAATNEVVYIGGGGERGNSTNMFDASMELAHKVARFRNARETFIVDVGHPSTRDLLKAQPQIKATQISKAEIIRGFEKLRARVNGSEFTSGENLLVVVESHGEESVDQEVTVATSDGLLDVEPFLKLIIEDAAKKGVKVGIFLGNCYSGTQLPRVDPSGKACIVSISAPGRVGYSQFSTQVVQKLGAGWDMEKSFLEARKNHLIDSVNEASFGLPQISTEAGLMTMNRMSVFSRHRFDPRDNSRALRDQISCEDDLKQIDQLKGLAGKALSATDFQEIENALTRFRRTTKFYGLTKEEVDRRVSSANHLEVSEINWCTRNVAASAEELKKWDLGDQTSYCEVMLYARSCVFQKSAGTICQRPEMVSLLKDKVFAGRVGFLDRTLKDVERELSSYVLNRPFHNKVFTNKEERTLYDGLYRSQAKVLSKTPNPCRDFKL